MDPTQWSQLGIGLAALATLVYVVRELRAMVRETNAFFGNHMSGLTKAVEHLAASSAALNEKVDRLHDDNVEAATMLRLADARRGQ